MQWYNGTVTSVGSNGLTSLAGNWAEIAYENGHAFDYRSKSRTASHIIGKHTDNFTLFDPNRRSGESCCILHC